ncbi:centromere protein L [Exaiptasia diaphana]|uniref:Centromere protein L n=1 Tax=Exaiptasia diaphana TaxID=2652724 RepID=A0A913X4I4_EXADI|nr:centromere protein L [Exaiptasia diaphana]
MAEENKEDDKNSSNYFTPLNPTRPNQVQKTWSSRKFTPYSITGSRRFTRILTSHSRVKKYNDMMKDPGMEITNLTPPDSPERLSSFITRTPGIAMQTNRELKDISSDICHIVGKTWRLHRCSPLHRFKTSFLQGYKRLLLGHLESIKTKGLAFEVGEEVYSIDGKFSVDISILQEFSFYDTDERALKVTVYQVVNNTSSPVLDAIFCNFGNDFQNWYGLDGFTFLPVCIVKGPVSLSRTVMSWFQDHFDCTIIPFKLPPIELTWYASLWAGLETDNKPCDFELCYTVPCSVKGLKKVSFCVDTGDVKLLWDSCHSNDSDIFTGEESQAFMEALNSHFYQHFRVHLGSLSLSRIRTSVVYLNSDGQIKILQAKYVRHILQQITAAALETDQHGRL